MCLPKSVIALGSGSLAAATRAGGSERSRDLGVPGELPMYSRNEGPQVTVPNGTVRPAATCHLFVKNCPDVGRGGDLDRSLSVWAFSPRRCRISAGLSLPQHTARGSGCGGRDHQVFSATATWARRAVDGQRHRCGGSSGLDNVAARTVSRMSSPRSSAVAPS
jgi:hypothetical protein